MTSLRFPDDFLTASLTTIGMDLLDELTTHNGHSIDGEALVDAIGQAVRDWLRLYFGFNLCCI